MIISMTAAGADSLREKIKRAIKYSGKAAEEVTQKNGQRLLDTVKMNASGRPGPNIITGAYVASIQITERSRWTVAVGSNAPQTMRLEFGFVGVDSIGRHYNQPPFPHFRPAENEIAPLYIADMHNAVRRIWR